MLYTGYLAQMQATAPPSSSMFTSQGDAEVELTSLEEGMLGVYLTGRIPAAHYSRDTPEYVCSPAPPYTCTRRDCHYFSAEAEGYGEPAQVELTVSASLEQI